MQEQITEWLDTDRFAEVNQAPDRSARFNFRIECDGEYVSAAQPRDGDYIVVACTHEFDAALTDAPRGETDEFRSRLQAVLTGTPGKHVFLNDEDVPVGLGDDFARLRLERGIFPDGGTQQLFVDAVERLAYARKSVGAQERRMLSESEW